MFTSINSRACPPTLYGSSEEPGYIMHGLPLQYTHEEYPSQQAQVVHRYGIHDTSPEVQQAQFRPEAWMPRMIPSDRPEQDMDDCKYPPHILERMGNYQKSPEPEEDYQDCTELLLRYHMLDEQYSKMEEELMNKLMDQEEMVDNCIRVMGEQDKKIKMLEKKERAHLKKGLVRKGKNPFGLRSRGGK